LRRNSRSGKNKKKDTNMKKISGAGGSKKGVERGEGKNWGVGGWALEHTGRKRKKRGQAIKKGGQKKEEKHLGVQQIHRETRQGTGRNRDAKKKSPAGDKKKRRE